MIKIRNKAFATNVFFFFLILDLSTNQKSFVGRLLKICGQQTFCEHLKILKFMQERLCHSFLRELIERKNRRKMVNNILRLFM